MDSKNKSNTEDATQSKFGLPSWMMNNIERLKFVSDFEQYACSPPEAESFLSDRVDNLDFHDASEPFCPIVITNNPVEEKPKLSPETKAEKDFEKYSFITVTEPVSPTMTIIDNLKHEEFYSSPDSTPCVTPEPSPALRRKLSGQQDSVQSNPGGWFYLGNIKKGLNVKGQCMNLVSSRGSRRKSSDKSGDSPIKVKDPVKIKKDKIKLAISNFDINAISPSSW